MINIVAPEPGTLLHELHECLSRLAVAGKITDTKKREILDEFDELEEDAELSLEFRTRLQELFNLDADVLEARSGTLKGNVAVLAREIQKEEAELDDTVDEEWDIVEGVARKQAEVYTWAKGVFDPLAERLNELQIQQDQTEHAALLRHTLHDDDPNKSTSGSRNSE